MSSNMIYLLVNFIALAGWILLFVSVFTSLKCQFLANRIIPAVLAVLYAGLMFSLIPFKGGGFDSLANLTTLFAQPDAVLVGWIHYLAFDLFIGGWQVETTKREQLSSIALVPSLLLTLFFGPLGLLFFLATRWAQNSKADAISPKQIERV